MKIHPDIDWLKTRLENLGVKPSQNFDADVEAFQERVSIYICDGGVCENIARIKAFNDYFLWGE